MELNWILTCVTAKGLMNRAHAYKAAVQANEEAGNDADAAVDMGLFCYPMLMSADILMFRANDVPVGRDQIQHVEMARDIAARFNHLYQDLFTLPQAKIDEEVETLVGLDGRKMSKSYGNTIPLFEDEKKLQKAVNKIVTNLKAPGEPKGTDESPLFEIYKAFATPADTAAFTQALADGLAWGEAKKNAGHQAQRGAGRQARTLSRADGRPGANRSHFAGGCRKSPCRSAPVAGKSA